MLVVRGTPAQATSAGHRLLRHVRQVGLLEQELLGELRDETQDGYVALPVGINNDSLSTWFVEAVTDCVARERLLLQLAVEDEAHTQSLLKNGDVIGCVTSTEQAPTGCTSQRLGVLRYRCVASRGFAEQHFASGVDHESLLKAPGIIFNRHDSLHLGFLDNRYGIGINEFPLQIVPSVHSLVDFVRAGLGYGICPELQLGDRLRNGELVDLVPDDPPTVTLYWQSWALQTPRLERFTRTLVDEARRRLPQ